jgi:transcription termination factor Rho
VTGNTTTTDIMSRKAGIVIVIGIRAEAAIIAAVTTAGIVPILRALATPLLTSAPDVVLITLAIHATPGATTSF